MKRHCAIGADILRQDARMWPSLRAVSTDGTVDESGGQQNPFLDMAASIALAHHEWWDGTGYPRRLSGEGIPLEARIVAVADVYDALSSSRPYKPAFPEAAVLGIMEKKAGSHFDRAVYEAFCRSRAAFREILGQHADEAEAA
jgi:putative two-component system response regulator